MAVLKTLTGVFEKGLEDTIFPAPKKALVFHTIFWTITFVPPCIISLSICTFCLLKVPVYLVPAFLTWPEV